ncbi:MAG TPA: isoaspartyl peptidase/L-asparaginase, partial [Caulobacter sp.]|nr:isoaspartyl peptidase/L-asparaginase [Caulobacter sp.]
MIRRVLLAFAALALLAAPAVAQERPGWAIVIHGGAGVIERANMDAATEAGYREALAGALAEGQRVLERGGSALDAV